MHFQTPAILSVALLIGFWLAPTQAEGPAYTKPRQAKKQDADFELQGEYLGEAGDVDVGAQVIAMGSGKFVCAVYVGGLPGDATIEEKLPLMEATKKPDGSVVFQGDEGIGILKDGGITVMHDGEEIGRLEKVMRKGKTLGKKPPEGAVVLFAGKNTDGWVNGKMDGKLITFAPRKGDVHGLTSNEKFGDHSLHVEFRLPYMPEARGQQRGNSGIYLQGRYEVQMLDSFGLEGKDNECGGIYKVARPKVNMCYPPLTWQTYDIDFTAAKYNDTGEVVANARMTVRHNGVTIHENLELPHKETTAAPNKAGPEDGPVFLQDHRNPVRYRNIWAVKK